MNNRSKRAAINVARLMLRLGLALILIGASLSLIGLAPVAQSAQAYAQLEPSGTTCAVAPQPAYGPGIAVDGNAGEWAIGCDFFADMYEAGNSNKGVKSHLYLRYDCTTQTLYALVLAANGVTIDTQPADSAFIKRGNSNKLVDGNAGKDGTPPDFAWIGRNGATALGWEASVRLAPGTYPDLNVHTNVQGGKTSAVVGRAIALAISCQAPTATPEPPTVTPTETPDPATPTPTNTPEPPTATPTPEPPTATPEPPTATPEPPTATPDPPTPTPDPPTATPTETPDPATPTPTVTPDPPTATPTSTATMVPDDPATPTPVPDDPATPTPIDPGPEATATPTPTNTPVTPTATPAAPTSTPKPSAQPSPSATTTVATASKPSSERPAATPTYFVEVLAPTALPKTGGLPVDNALTVLGLLLSSAGIITRRLTQ